MSDSDDEILERLEKRKPIINKLSKDIDDFLNCDYLAPQNREKAIKIIESLKMLSELL